MDLSIKEISIENEKINREKFFSVGFCPEIQRYLLCVHISWVVGYDRYYAIDEEDIALYEESLDEFICKLVDCLEKCLIYGHIRRFAD